LTARVRTGRLCIAFLSVFPAWHGREFRDDPRLPPGVFRLRGGATAFASPASLSVTYDPPARSRLPESPSVTVCVTVDGRSRGSLSAGSLEFPPKTCGPTSDPSPRAGRVISALDPTLGTHRAAGSSAGERTPLRFRRERTAAVDASSRTSPVPR
jgi:hypothetical protein